MLDKQLRHVKENVLNPIAIRVGEYLTPMQLTLLGGVVGAMSAGVAGHGWYSAGLCLWLLNRLIDGLDGTVARIFDKQSDIGGYIDIIIDVTIYALVPIGIAVSVASIEVYLTLIFMLATFYVNIASWIGLSSILEKRNLGSRNSGEMTTITMPDGLIEGTETVLFYSLFFIFPQWLTFGFVLMGALVIITIVQRMLWALRSIR